MARNCCKYCERRKQATEESSVTYIHARIEELCIETRNTIQTGVGPRLASCAYQAKTLWLDFGGMKEGSEGLKAPSQHFITAPARTAHDRARATVASAIGARNTVIAGELLRTGDSIRDDQRFELSALSKSLLNRLFSFGDGTRLLFKVGLYNRASYSFFQAYATLIDANFRPGTVSSIDDNHQGMSMRAGGYNKSESFSLWERNESANWQS